MFTKRTEPQNKGVILVMAIFLVLLLTTMVIAFYFVINSELKIVRNYQYALDAKYTAEAGVETAIASLRNNCNLNGLLPDNGEYPSGSNKYFRVSLENYYPFVTITSTGEVRNWTYNKEPDILFKELKVLVMVSGPPQLPPYKIRVDSWTEL